MPGRSAQMKRILSFLANFSQSATSRREEGVPWMCTMGVPLGGPYSAKPRVRPSGRVKVWLSLGVVDFDGVGGVHVDSCLVGMEVDFRMHVGTKRYPRTYIAFQAAVQTISKRLHNGLV